MSSRLPDFVDPWRLANLGKQLSGAVGLGELSRLAEALVSVEGESLFTLEFYRDEKKRARIKGNVEAELVLECQRCLEPVTLPVDAEVNLAVIEVAAEAELLPDECDPVMVEEGRIQLLDLIEDELLLAIPQVPMHPQAHARWRWRRCLPMVTSKMCSRKVRQMRLTLLPFWLG